MNHSRYEQKVDHFTTCLNYLLTLSKDYQFDLSCNEYCGMINADPTGGIFSISKENVDYIINNRLLFDTVLRNFDREIESISYDELIIVEIKD